MLQAKSHFTMMNFVVIKIFLVRFLKELSNSLKWIYKSHLDFSTRIQRLVVARIINVLFKISSR